ncbi:MAG: VWA domain-containing protein [Gammaproteobacteria bacterium]|nr:VWA domain-containing protein [Gammaproteobacteria bacterium]
MSSEHRALRRQLNPISLSFLDVMFCGFGAVILIFLILDHTSTQAEVVVSPEQAAEIKLLQEEVEEGQLGLVRLRNTLSDLDFDMVEAQGLARQIQETIDSFLQELAAMENSSLATKEDVVKLRADVRQLEEELRRLQASALEREGASVRQFIGDGQRQYLSGLYLGGQRIMIVVDASASMLDDTLVNIIRTSLRDKIYRQEAPKWQRVVKTVDWITTQLPIVSRYQIYTFNEEVRAALPGSEGNWLEVADRDQLDEVVQQVIATAPEGGTNLERMFREVANMTPPPDNIYLITDGLPTIDDRGARRRLITPRDRLELYEDALGELLQRVPVNTILMPLEGDPDAAAAFWKLAQDTQGSMMSPSKDWPGGESAVEVAEPEKPREDSSVARVESTEEISEGARVSFPTNI